MHPRTVRRASGLRGPHYLTDLGGVVVRVFSVDAQPVVHRVCARLGVSPSALPLGWRVQVFIGQAIDRLLDDGIALAESSDQVLLGPWAGGRAVAPLPAFIGSPMQLHHIDDVG